MDLVDEEDGARLERTEQGGDVALALERRAGGLHEGHLELGGDDLRQRGLAQARRPGEQHVVERLAARGCRLDGDLQLLAQPVLAHELLEGPRAQRAVELVLVVERARSLDALETQLRAPRSALASSSSAVSPSAAASISCASAGWKPSSSRPSRAMWRGSSPRVTVIGAAEVVRHADLLAQLDDDPLGGALADAGHRLQAGDVAGHQRCHELARGPAAEHGERHLRPHRLHADEREEEVALLLGGEAVERERVVAHHEMGVQGHRAAHAGDLAQRLGRHGQAVADPARGLDHHVVGAADRHLSGDERDHPATAAAAANGAWLAWQMATASASAAWSGRGGSGSDSSVWTMRGHLALVGAAGAADRALDLLRGVVDAVDAALAGGEQDDATCLSDRESCANVLTEKQCFKSDGVGLVLVEQLAQARCAASPAGAPRAAPRRWR